MISQSLYFERSDGSNKNAISGFITASVTAGTLTTAHILCQNSSSVMQLYYNGNLIASTPSTLTKQLRNKANLYIGSFGKKCVVDSNTTNTNKYFNGDINIINIWSRAYNATQITKKSESI